jgi:hypothetical protein
MKHFGSHNTLTLPSHLRRRHAILIAVAVAAAALAWVVFNAVIRVVTLD